MDIDSFLDFLHAAEKLKCATRHCDTTSGRRESVAEHSFRLVMMAELVRGEYPTLDMDKVVKMCIFHDLGEAVTGDIPAFLKNDSDRAVESDAVDSLIKILGEPEYSELKPLFSEMEALETPEAKLYKSLDKLEALIQHNEADISGWLPREYELQLTYGDKECEFSPFTKKLRERVKADSAAKISAERKKLHESP